MQLKKILAIFLAAALIFSATSICAVADTNETLKVGVSAMPDTPIRPLNAPIIADQEEEVVVTIRVQQNTGISYLLLETLFDANALEYVGYESTDLMLVVSVGLANDGSAVRSLIFPNNVSTATGDLITLKFKTVAGYCGNTTIKTLLKESNPNNCYRYDAQKNRVNVPFTGGTDIFTIHDMNKGEGVVTDATCSEMGYTTYVCADEDCGKTIQADYTQKLPHTPAEAVEENRKEATCTAKGSFDSVVYCSVCEEELSREAKEIAIIAHTPAEAVEENRKEATCTEKGSYDVVVYCSVCEGELSREKKEIAIVEHTPAEAVEENRKEATCTEKGSYDSVVYCSVCEGELSRETKEIAIVAHTPAAAVEENRKEATCTEKGSYDSVVYCSVCEGELSREAKEIAIVAHTYGETTVVAPQVGKEGYSVHTCTVCQYEEKFDFVDALSGLVGDINEDGKVDTSDVIQLLLHISMPTQFQVNVPANFTDDGQVTTADVIQLLLHVSMPSSFPLVVYPVA